MTRALQCIVILYDECVTNITLMDPAQRQMQSKLSGGQKVINSSLKHPIKSRCLQKKLSESNMGSYISQKKKFFGKQFFEHDVIAINIRIKRGILR